MPLQKSAHKCKQAPDTRHQTRCRGAVNERQETDGYGVQQKKEQKTSQHEADSQGKTTAAARRPLSVPLAKGRRGLASGVDTWRRARDWPAEMSRPVMAVAVAVAVQHPGHSHSAPPLTTATAFPSATHRRRGKFVSVLHYTPARHPDHASPKTTAPAPSIDRPVAPPVPGPAHPPHPLPLSLTHTFSSPCCHTA